ncbi:hypothetical protein BDV96DRAFT_646497 [Lophiotrema nucula]|uniref:tyrosinase n=1 Tax=Lophiotrema nucula TaxID=690887 RepID=A0A6A5Z7L4_9PLEO|nr:hypothetical protein BDV96DRAFT_646497 [Lophiotrema nucula]
MATAPLPLSLKLLFLVQFFFTLTCSAQFNESNALEGASPFDKRQSNFFPVVGVSALGGSNVDPRLEIRQLEKNPDQWNVYLLALRKFQNMSQSDKRSYYQIAGIHGRPYTAWDGVKQASGGSGGYCTHGSNIFPTWHRPYLVLFEQMLYLNAQQAVNEFPAGALKTRYTTALSSLRMPYWDWAAIPPSGQSVLPSSLTKTTVTVTTPKGVITIPNPLFSYTFHPLSASDMGNSRPWSIWTQTLRDPSSNTASNAVSRNNLIAQQLDSNRPNIQSRVYNVLALEHDYTSVSNDRQPGDSLESTHDTIHNLVGSDGHMSVIAYAAFDPIFWLHHANVDRMFAIWQALNPNSYVTPVNNPYATFTMKSGTTADMNSALTPFHSNSAGKFWTSALVRQTSTFGYTYPELIGTNTRTLTAKINQLYGPNATTSSSKRSLDESYGEVVERGRGGKGVAGAPNFSGERHYVANTRVQKFGLDGSFNIYIFLGDTPGNDSSTWATESSFVGLTGIFSTMSSQQSDDVKATSDVNGAVPLTAALEAKVLSGELSGMDECTVAKYLQTNLKWKISKVNGEAIAVENTPGFVLSVLWAKIRPARSTTEFPQIVDNYRTLVDATGGRPGGLQPGGSLRARKQCS